jgi:hypothetical protein
VVLSTFSSVILGISGLLIKNKVELLKVEWLINFWARDYSIY